MTLLYQVIYATHANGTHHKLALDALSRLNTARAQDWSRLFLKHAELYMQGSKAPDKEFKDFRNHVLHPGDKYWGGAPEKARSWYNHLVTALKDRNWSEAVWCAGVLSHYYTDPIQPFHTAQSDAESAIHRATEWSINRSYNDLYALGQERAPTRELSLPKGKNWIEEFVCKGADTSHKHYERLIAHYDINAGASDPPAGLDTVARNLIADLLIYATTGFALILDRAIEESGVEPPHVDLSLDTFLATLKIPLKWVLKKMDDATERKAVRDIYDELMATGRVEQNLSQDDRTIRDLHAKEVREPRMEKRRNHLRRRVGKKAILKKTSVLSTLSIQTKEKREFPRLIPLAASTSTQIPAHEPAIPSPQENKITTHPKTRIYLKGSDPLEAAPAIGPKTAKRLEAAGIITVNDLLHAEPESIKAKVAHSRITTSTITDWQDFAKLVMSVPNLRGTHAQLLVGAGYRTQEAIAQADPAELSANVLNFATGKAGHRILRDGTPPDIEKIKSWVENASQTRAA